MSSKNVKMNKDGSEIREYTCPWPNCGNVFERIVSKHGMGHSAWSTRVVCPRCKNGLKTWE